MVARGFGSPISFSSSSYIARVSDQIFTSQFTLNSLQSIPNVLLLHSSFTQSHSPDMAMTAKILCAAVALPVAHAWGTLGHVTIAYLAQNHLTSRTANWAQSILNDTSDSYLADVAT